jgi:hypothetical protein
LRVSWEWLHSTQHPRLLRWIWLVRFSLRILGAKLKFYLADVISTSNAFLWTQLETCVGIICACLPTLKGPLGKLVPTLFNTSRGRSTRDAYEIDTFDKKASHSAWKDNTKNSRSATKMSMDDSSSQERIIGITKTVDVQVTSLNHNSKIRTTAQGEMFRP